MRSRWTWFLMCAVLGAVMLICGLLVPAHLRAIDVKIVQLAGRNSPALVDRGMALAADQQLGAAQLVLQAAQQENLADREKLGAAVTNLSGPHPDWRLWGRPEQELEQALGSPDDVAANTEHQADARPRKDWEPFIDYIVLRKHREKALAFLADSPRFEVQAILACRTLTNTTVFAPSASASGQAIDAAIAMCGLLLEEGRLSPGLRDKVSSMATAACKGGDSQPLEQVLLDFMSLGERLNWGQLVALVGHVDDAATLRSLANLIRQDEGHLPVIFSAVELTGKPAAVAAYLVEFNRTGPADLAASLRYGTGAVDGLIQSKRQLYRSDLGASAAAFGPFTGLAALLEGYTLRSPGFALALKWLLYLAGGYLLAAAAHFARPAASALEQPLQVRGFHVAREILFALGFLLVVLLLSEPFLAQESQKVEFPFRISLPTVGRPVPAGNAGAHPSIINMNPKSLLTLVLFFVLQALIYIACLVKLAEIRRQRVPSRVKLKLLENEDHLFDAGLYLGFAGTIVSLILVSLGVIQPSLMAAYSSTSFGIVFVSIFKIFHLRPVRRGLLLDAEAAAPPDPAVKAPAPAYAAQP